MTAEILIMNRSAIAMAADSNVTIGIEKTYTGVNKLFMLSNNPPMGIMIYGNADLLQIPMETLIKEYRNHLNNNKLDNVKIIMDEFLEFLEKYCLEKSDYKTLFKMKITTFQSYFHENSQVIREKVIKEIMDESINFNDPLELISNKEIEEYEYIFEDITSTVFEKEKNKSDIKCFLKQLFIESLYEESTGVVIAGFNKEDPFPSYTAYNIVSIFEEKLKYYKLHEMINTNNAIISPFAQRDVVDTFLGGIDLEASSRLKGFFEKTIESYPKKIINAIEKNKKIKKEELEKIKNELNIITESNNELIEKFDQEVKFYVRESTAPIMESIAVLPKEELANICESLIHITSLKRKIASDLETVGGEIDVAIISKGDGFIWKKRKHYFDSELNYQFFIKKNI